MARLWIEQNDDKEFQQFKSKLDSWVENTDKPFLDFLKIYYDYLKNTDERFKLLDKIPPERVRIHSSLEYPNLREAVKERILKLKLLADVLARNEIKMKFDINKNLINLMNALDEKKLNQLRSGNRNEILNQIAKIIFSAWQTLGAPWDYSRGGITEFSLRDLTLDRNPSKTTPEGLEHEESIKFLDLVPKFVTETNIDDKESIRNLAEKRSKFIHNLFEDKDFKEATDDPNFFFGVRASILEKKGEWALYRGCIRDVILSRSSKIGIAIGVGSITAGLLGLIYPLSIIGFAAGVAGLVFGIASITTDKILRAFCMERAEAWTSCHNLSDVFVSKSLNREATGYRIQTLHFPYQRNDEPYSQTTPKNFWFEKI